MKRRPRQAVDPGGNETADHTLCLCGCRHDRLLANQHNRRSRHCVITNLFVRANGAESSSPVDRVRSGVVACRSNRWATIRLGPCFRTGPVPYARQAGGMDTTEPITAFRIAIPDAHLDDLHDRLRRTRFPAPLPGDGWDTGVPVSYLKELVTHWDHAYDWRAAETELNQLPNSRPRSTVRPSISCTCVQPS